MKKVQFSPVLIAVFLIVVVLVAYYAIYFVPAQAELVSAQGEITVLRMQADTYRPYLDDISPIEADIAKVADEIEQMHRDGYVNATNVSMVISDAIQRFGISLSSISLGKETKIDNCRALPINLSIAGTFDNVVEFVSYFENNTEGSYLAQGCTVSMTAKGCEASLVLYLCTPSV